MTQKRKTTQKLKIIEYLKKVKTHPSAETIYKDLKKELPGISLATIYRNLNLLVQEKKIIKFERNNTTYFDGNLTTHQHCICKKCRKIIDLFNEDITKFAMNHFNPKEFYPTGVEIIFDGYCTKCKR